jgi:BlaI family penicillinase repressor
MKLNSLTESESIAMKCVWDLGDEHTRLAQIMSRANDYYKKNWKPQTVSTFLGKLVRKGYLSQYRDGRYFYYRILISKHEYCTQQLRGIMDFWDDGNIDLFCDELFDKKTFTLSDRKTLVQRAQKL